MSRAAEPRPASLPLPGGRGGAAVKLHPLLVARMIGPPAAFHREEGRLAALKALGFRVPREKWLDIPVVAFLVEHPGAGPMLIDTGFHAGVAVEPRKAFGRLAGRVFREVAMEPKQALPEQLREREIEPADVSVVALTHLHADHAGGISQFPDSTFLLSDEEWRAARSGGRLQGYYRRLFDHPFEYRTLDFDGPASDSFATFGRSLDVLGDGSVRLVFTPGHSRGHLSVVLRLKGREALLTGDAAYTMRTLRESHLPHSMDDEHLFRRSLREIQLYAEATPDALVIPGHDMEHWRSLDAVYE
jgi:N-acyl homoserine lactone hydrolase